MLALLASGLQGCGDGALLAGAEPPPPPPERRLIFSTAFAPPLAPFGAVAVVQVPAQPVTIPSPGRVEVVLDWTFSTSNFDLVVADSACDSSSLAGGRCNVLASDRGAAKPAGVSFDSSGGSITVFSLQLAGPQESAVVSVWLTPR